jgi:hypothetical protein
VKPRDPKQAPSAKVVRKTFQRMTRFDITVEGDHPAQATLRAYQESDGRQRMAFDLVMPPKTFMPCADDHRDAVALERTVGLLRSVADELEKHRGRVRRVRIPVVGEVLVPLYGASEPSSVVLARARQILEAEGTPESAILDVAEDGERAVDLVEERFRFPEEDEDEDEEDYVELAPGHIVAHGVLREAVSAFNNPDLNYPPAPPTNLGLRNEDDL